MQKPRKTRFIHGGRTAYQACRTDANHAQISAAFKYLGCTVQSLHTIGGGCPDLLVGISGINLVVEVKDGRKVPSRRKLTPYEETWFRTWRGQRCVIKDVEEVQALVKTVRDYAARIVGAGISLEHLNFGG